MPIELAPAQRRTLRPLFAGCRYDLVILDSVLEGHFGRAFADSLESPTVARLIAGEFTILGGDPHAPAVKELLALAPIEVVTPQSEDWRARLQADFGERITEQAFTEFSAASLRPEHLAELSQTLPEGFALRRIDRELAERLPAETGNEYFFETFHSLDDFLARGVGFCVLHEGKIAGAAASMSASSRAIDIEIEVLRAFRRQGLGAAVGAQLALDCLVRGIEPCWLASNPVSERLAEKIGYTRAGSYITFELNYAPVPAPIQPRLRLQ